ncbi:hypothetical protein M1L60_16470 [Actinoplanes sp. TRM 88003]|uniref:EF-hand domain-containing protein n=1 Tax=Paractinoplanes aksuensis TaxID=2939490 RepID=A0ABT1DN15_9ACTN|nr:hypothetical protein [Actinoplanes aksuensis]MCO8272190.1 hypothetical protein [Actinoplanes aksuensis]
MVRHDGENNLGVWSEFGTVAGMVADRTAEDVTADGPGAAQSGFGDRPDLDGLPDITVGATIAEAAVGLAPPEGYDNTVDADGDGTDEDAIYLGRADGGVDILVDVNGDGAVDFVGTDVDLDNRVDFADYDKDRDGVFEKRMFDDDGDGFLDRAEFLPGS